MQSTLRPQDAERLHPQRRRGHVPQISISDDNHHVTEAIGDLYGDNDDWSSTRPNSYVDSKQEREFDRDPSAYHQPSSFTPTSNTHPGESASDRSPGPSNGSLESVQRKRTSSLNSLGGGSPPSLTRSPSTDTASQHFPLNDIDYESSPAAVAQEISNLQAIRRMSMNVDAADPDLPAFGHNFAVPAVAPSHSADENDTARLFWVPARLHPELAPTDYKSFVENRVERIRRGSTAEDSLSPESPHRRISGGSMNRRSSMLRKTIDNSADYRDGAELLERKKSGHRLSAETTLEDLGNLVNDPQGIVRKMSVDSGRASLESIGEGADDADLPMLPSAPGGQSLKRSTRTNYRRGSLKKGERVPFSKRAQSRRQESRTSDEQLSSPIADGAYADQIPNKLLRAQTEPLPPLPALPPPVPQSPIVDTSDHSTTPLEDTSTVPESPRGSLDTEQPRQHHPRSFQSRIASNGRTTAQLPGFSTPTIHDGGRPSSSPMPLANSPSQPYRPERSSSQEYSRNAQYPAGSQPKVQVRPGIIKTKPAQTLNDMANNPSAMLGTNTNTDQLSFIPTFAEESRPEKEKKKNKDSESGRKSSWGWLLGNDSKDRDKKEREAEKEREKEERELVKKAKKLKVADKPDKPQDIKHDSTRLDVLQTATEGPRGRESLVLDRESIKIDDDRKKDSSRKNSSEAPKKEPGLFLSLFGKKKSSDAINKRRDSNRGLSPEPPRPILRPDIDYNWTRFSIMEERAIYRMAHIKLANPRRALYSQVLLSNFMYSYLAKVQQMHLIPAFIQKQQQPRQHEQQPQQQQGGQDAAPSAEMVQWQRYQQQQQQQEQEQIKLQQQQQQLQHQRQQQQQSLAGFDLSYDGAASNGTTFIEDYDPGHQHQQDMAAQQQAQQYGHRYDHSQQQQQQQQQHQQQAKSGGWDHRDHYTQQGLFDDVQPANDDDMW